MPENKSNVYQGKAGSVGIQEETVGRFSQPGEIPHGEGRAWAAVADVLRRRAGIPTDVTKDREYLF